MKKNKVKKAVQKKSFFKIKPFYLCSFLVAVILFSFQFWLYWPGYIQDDSQTTFMLVKINWHPVIMAYLIEWMYYFFGYHLYHLYLLMLIPFYLAILIIVNTAYLKTKSWWSLLFFFPCFIANVFYAEVKMGCSAFSMSWIMLLYAMTLYVALNPILTSWKKKLFFTAYGIVFTISLLSRHNAILQVWPITIFWIMCYLSQKEWSLWNYLKRFCLFSFLSGIFCAILMFGLNGIMVRADNGNVYPATQIIIHQIVGACAPELDESCFNPDWWRGSWVTNPQRMRYLKKRYEGNQLSSEPFALRHYSFVPFKIHTNLEGRFSKWIYAIAKHPVNYLQHLKRYYKAFWFSSPDLVTQDKLLTKYTKEGMVFISNLWNPPSEREEKFRLEMVEKMPKDEMGIKWDDKHIQIDNFIRTYYPSFNIFWFVCLNFITFIIASVFFFKRQKNVLKFMLFASSLSGVMSCIIIPAFSPIILIRYMNPVIFSSLLSLIFLILMLQKKNLSDMKDWIFRKIKAFKKGK